MCPARTGQKILSDASWELMLPLTSRIVLTMRNPLSPHKIHLATGDCEVNNKKKCIASTDGILLTLSSQDSQRRQQRG